MWKLTVTPRWGEVDILGHVNNTVLALYFEQARRPLWELFTPGLKISVKTWPIIVAHTDYDFLDELVFEHDIEIRSVISRIGTKSFTIHHEAWQEGRFCVKGDAVMVYYDFNTKKSVPIPEDKKALLAEHQEKTP